MENEKLIRNNLNQYLRSLLHRNIELQLHNREIFLIASAIQFLNEPNNYSNKEEISLNYHNIHMGYDRVFSVRLFFSSKVVSINASEHYSDIEGTYNAGSDYLSLPLGKSKPETTEVITRVFEDIFYLGEKYGDKPSIYSDLQSLKKTKEATIKFTLDILMQTLDFQIERYGSDSKDARKTKLKIEKLKAK